MGSVAGMSNVMPAKSLMSFVQLAQKATSRFIAENAKVGQGTSGQSRISVRA